METTTKHCRILRSAPSFPQWYNNIWLGKIVPPTAYLTVVCGTCNEMYRCHNNQRNEDVSTVNPKRQKYFASPHSQALREFIRTCLNYLISQQVDQKGQLQYIYRFFRTSMGSRRVRIGEICYE